jgi:hypothetical protein
LCVGQRLNDDALNLDLVFVFRHTTPLYLPPKAFPGIKCTHSGISQEKPEQSCIEDRERIILLRLPKTTIRCRKHTTAVELTAQQIEQMQSGSLTSGRFALPAARTADRLFLLDSTQLTLRNVPALATDSAENARIRHTLTETTQELFLRFIGSQSNGRHINLTPFLPGFFGRQARDKSQVLLLRPVLRKYISQGKRTLG